MLPETPSLPTLLPQHFFAVDLRIGTVLRVEDFPEARKPALKIWVDFGSGVGTLATSAQIRALYEPESLLGRQVIGWINAPTKKIGPFMSQFLLLGAYNEALAVVLLQPAQMVPNGARVC